MSTSAGLLAIGFAIGSTYGFCSLIGIIFSPLMTVLPLYAPSSRKICSFVLCVFCAPCPRILDFDPSAVWS